MHEGGCHCGAIRFRVSGVIDELTQCNCSICSKTGYLHWEVAPEQFTLESGERAITNYRFGSRTAQNYFCSTCGISPFRRSRSAPDQIDINARCLEDLDLAAIPVATFDGVHWEEQMQALSEADSELD